MSAKRSSSGGTVSPSGDSAVLSPVEAHAPEAAAHAADAADTEGLGLRLRDTEEFAAAAVDAVGSPLRCSSIRFDCTDTYTYP